MSGGGRRTGAGAERGGGDSRARGRGEQSPVAVLIGPPGAGKSTVGPRPAAVRRVGLDTPRPLLLGNPRGRMRELLAERLPVYESLARITVVTDDRDPQEIADEIAAAITARIAAAAGEGAGTEGDWAGEGD